MSAYSRKDDLSIEPISFRVGKHSISSIIYAAGLGIDMVEYLWQSHFTA